VTDPSGYLPVSEHGLIGDLHTVALVGTNGTIDWHCSPSFDAPSVFGSILDSDGGGSFELAAAVPAKTRQFYLPDTNVLITRFFSEDGVGEIQDFMPVGGPAEARRNRLIRRVVCVRGAMPFRARIAPRFGYGTDPHTLTETEAGVVFTSDSLTVGLSVTVPVEHDGRDVTAEFKLAEGESAVFALDEVSGGAEPCGCSGEEAEELGEATIAFWRTWLSASRYRGRWREIVNRSALTLKLLTYAPTGAIVAAPTTSLPEQIGGERNWDYRYVWVRDAAFCVYALLRLGFSSEAGAFMRFILRHATPREGSVSGPMQVMYGIDGRTDLPERELPHLAGYLGSRPVRIGNAAAKQLQAGHLRRAHGLGLPLRRLAAAHLQRPVGCDHHPGRLAQRSLGSARRGHLGDPRWPKEVPVLAAHVLGGDGTGDPAGHPQGAARRPGTLARRARRHLPADHGPRLVTRAQRVRPI
jgi:GH15 family glucan-1,4-alpha-glucosidase